MPQHICIKCGNEFTGDRRRKYCDICSPDKNKYMKQFYAKPDQKKKSLDRSRKYAVNNREKINARNRERRWNERNEAILAYGGKCVCCGESELKFLTLDHINRDGNEHRKALLGKSDGRAGVMFYRKLRQAGYPNGTPLQVLCWNCHMAKDKYGECPHQTK